MNLESFATTAGFLFFASAVNQEAAQSEVLLDSTLRLLSIAGAIGGGFMALAFFPTPIALAKKEGVSKKSAIIRADAARWLACSIFGGSFAPFVAESVLPCYGLPLTASTTLATSAFLGMFAWLLASVLHGIIQSKINKIH